MLGKEELDRIIDLSRRGDSKYDCIVPLSGGCDGCYVLYIANALYKLKILAVNYDNEFRHDQAAVNMQRPPKILGVDFVSVRSKRDISQKNELLFLKTVWLQQTLFWIF